MESARKLISPLPGIVLPNELISGLVPVSLCHQTRYRPETNTHNPLFGSMKDNDLSICFVKWIYFVRPSEELLLFGGGCAVRSFKTRFSVCGWQMTFLMLMISLSLLNRWLIPCNCCIFNYQIQFGESETWHEKFCISTPFFGPKAKAGHVDRSWDCVIPGCNKEKGPWHTNTFVKAEQDIEEPGIVIPT